MARLCASPATRGLICETSPSVAITERRAHDIVTDLTTAGYVVKSKEGRRNRYTIQTLTAP